MTVLATDWKGTKGGVTLISAFLQKVPSKRDATGESGPRITRETAERHTIKLHT